MRISKHSRHEKESIIVLFVDTISWDNLSQSRARIDSFNHSINAKPPSSSGHKFTVIEVSRVSILNLAGVVHLQIRYGMSYLAFSRSPNLEDRCLAMMSQLASSDYVVPLRRRSDALVIADGFDNRPILWPNCGTQVKWKWQQQYYKVCFCGKFSIPIADLIPKEVFQQQMK